MRFLAIIAILVLAGCASPQEYTADTEGLAGVPWSVAPVGEDPGTFRSIPSAPLGYHEVLHVKGAAGAFALEMDIDFDEARDNYIDVQLQWDGTKHKGVELRYVGADIRRGFDSVRAIAYGAYPIENLTLEAAGDFWGTIRLRATDVPAVDDLLLPDLVTLTPIEIGMGECELAERVEERAVRCLRLGNAVGNVGDGPLEVHLDHVNAALSVGKAGAFQQRIYKVGGYDQRQASGAEFHVMHGHFHYAGLAHFELHEYESDSGLRGDLVATGHKRGFCFLDWGKMDVPEAPSEGAQHAETNCLYPGQSGWSMGVTRGWYDYYWPGLDDQYIDIEGVSDGVYELVSIADGAGTLMEISELNNKASVVLELRGDSVLVLEERSWYDNPERE